MRAAIVVLMLTGSATAQDKPASESQIRRDCTMDALRYCKAVIPSGRMSIINCMLENRDKLQAKCSRHLR